ncbi:RNA-directed DNA polymerase, eukaryota [Tanacetum coccineum]
MSVLVNGSHTDEISLHRGLCQGDQLSLFLFFIAMEGLHLAIEKAIVDNKISGASVGVDRVKVSHLLCADDVINVGKSNMYGVGVSSDEISNMAAFIGCASGNLPFNYLGITIEASMATKGRWDSIVERFKDFLSKWKENMLYGSQEDAKKIAWEKVIAAKERGGLGIAIYGEYGGLDSREISTVKTGTWARIIGSSRDVRGGTKYQQLQLLTQAVSHVALREGQDKLWWDIDLQGIFSIGITRKFIDNQTLLGSNIATRWCSSLPRKVNIFMWRARLNKLPTRYNLSPQGIKIVSIMCPVCGVSMESLSHVLFTCTLAKEVWMRVYNWWQVYVRDIYDLSEWFDWCDHNTNVRDRK